MRCVDKLMSNQRSSGYTPEGRIDLMNVGYVFGRLVGFGVGVMVGVGVFVGVGVGVGVFVGVGV